MRLVCRIGVGEELKHDVLFFIDAAKENTRGNNKNADTEDGSGENGPQRRKYE